MILQKARATGPLLYENAEVSFFPDFTQLVQKQRCTFQSVKKRLRDKGLKYAMLFPAQLRVEADGRVWFFEQPEMVADWLEA